MFRPDSDKLYYMKPLTSILLHEANNVSQETQVKFTVYHETQDHTVKSTLWLLSDKGTRVRSAGNNYRNLQSGIPTRREAGLF